MAFAGPASEAFTVSGKKGPFLKQVAGRNFGVGQGSGEGLGLASDAVNQGRYQAARLRMPQTEAKIAELVARLDAGWPYAKAPPPPVYVIGLNYYNAYALPDNSIVVGFGLLDSAQSDDEIAFVLAHEMGHLRLGHFAQRERKSAEPFETGDLAQAFVVAGALANMRGGNSAIQAAAAQAAASSDFLRYLNGSMVEPSHSQAQEDEADAVGYDLSTLAAFSADAASARVFDTIQADTQQRKAVSDTLDKQRADDLKDLGLDTSQLQSIVSGGRPSTSDMISSGTALFGKALQGMRPRGGAGEDAAPKHRPPEERKKGIAQYSTDAYPQGAPLRDEQKVWLTAVRGTDEYAQAKAAVAAVYDAMKARAAGDYPAAQAALARAQATSFATAPVVMNEAARLQDDMGDGAQADRLFRQAHLSPDQSVQGYIDHISMLWRRDETQPADDMLRAGIRRFNEDEKPFMALQIAVAKQAGRDTDVGSLLERCADYGDRGLLRDCKLAAGQDPNASDSDNSQQAAPSPPFSIPGLPHP